MKCSKHADGESVGIWRCREHPDLILVDLRLPGEIDGFELSVNKAKPELSRIPPLLS